MRALCWHGKNDIRYDTVPDPAIEAPARRDRQGHAAAPSAAPTCTSSTASCPA